ncbi:DNA-binding protein [Sulfolobales archaeon HS-7]|nr:DNA-binding protein [Sulfolobales archaeon HS-7]
MIRYVPKAKYSYSAGQAQSVFLNGLKEKKILGTVCNKCKKVYVPPKMYCEECFKPTDGWVELKDEGIVHTAIASFVSWTRDRLEEPIISGTIKLYGSERDYVFPGMFHRICTTYDKVRDMSIIGAKVKAVWNEKRVGSIEDIQCFKEV